MAAGGLALEGVSCLFIPFATNYWVMMLPISTICFGIALIDTALLPMLGLLVDTRHVSVYGSIYAIADISYCMAYAFGPIIAGNLVNSVGFTGLNIGIAVSNVIYAPMLYILCYWNKQQLQRQGETEQINMADHPSEYKSYAALEDDGPAHGEKYAMEETQLDGQYQAGYGHNGSGYGQNGGYVQPSQQHQHQQQPQQYQQPYQQHQQQQYQQAQYQPVPQQQQQVPANGYAPQPPARPPAPRQESIGSANAANPFRPPTSNPFRSGDANPFRGGAPPT